MYSLNLYVYTVQLQIFIVQKVHESFQISVKVNFRAKNFVITLNFHDLMLTLPFFSECAIEVKIYTRTDIFSDLRLQRSKRSNNSARSSEQQDMQALGQFLIPKTIVECGDKKSRLKIHCAENFFPPPPERKDKSSCPSIGFAYEPILCCSHYKFGQR